MKQEDKFEKITIDLRPYGWGIRDVDVVWPEGHEGGEITPGVPIPENTVDSRSIQDDSIEMEDLNQKVKDAMLTDEDRVTQEEIDNFNV